MADKSVSLQVKINTETGALDVLGAKFQDTAKKAESAGSSFKKLGGQAGDLVKQFLPLATAGGVIAFFTSAVKAAEEYNQTLLRLKGNLAAAGLSFEDNEKQIIDWSEAIQAATRFDNDVALKTLERFVRITGDVTQAQRLSTLAFNLSVRSGRELQSVTDMLAQSLSGGTLGARMLNKEFGALTGGGKDVNEVLNNLQLAAAGAAEQEKSLTKDINQATAAYGDLSKEVGQALLPAVSAVAKAVLGIVKTVQSLGSMLGGVFAAAFDGFKGLAGAMLAASTGHFTRARVIAASTALEIKEDFKRTNDDLNGIWESQSAKQVQEAMKAGTGRIETSSVADAAVVAAREQANERLAEIENQLDVRMAALGEKGLQQRLAVIAAEYKAEKDKTSKIEGDEKKKAAVLSKLASVHAANVKKETDAEVKLKQTAVLDTLDYSLQAISTLNSMEGEHTKAQATRAKVILALEKAIAIARVWSAPSTGPWDVGLKTAQTALVVAQFAQQSRAIDQARSAANEAASTSLSVANTDTGITETFNGGTSGAAAAGSSGGGSVGAAVPAIGGGVIVTNVGGVNVYFNADHVDLAEIDVIMRRIADAVRQGTVEGVRLAVTLANSGTRNGSLAV